MSEEATAQQEAQSTPKKEILPIKKQVVYRLPNGEFDDFAEIETIDKTDFHKVFHREMLQDGQLVFEVEYDKDGNEVQKTQNTFDDAGKVILHELYTEGALAEKTIYERDEKGNVLKEIREFDEGFPLTTYFKYDDEGRVVEARVDDSDGELQKRETFVYHPVWKDKITLHEVFDEENEISLKEENEWEEREGEVKAKRFTVNDYSLDRYRRTEFFDPRTREDNIAMATFNNKEKVTEYVKIIFDEQGRELEEHSISVNDSDNFIVYYTYDEQDRVTRQEQHQQDKIISKINRRFGESGMAELIGIRSFSRGMYVDFFEYDFYEA
jgi:YD repeat-containing protein